MQVKVVKPNDTIKQDCQIIFVIHLLQGKFSKLFHRIYWYVTSPLVVLQSLLKVHLIISNCTEVLKPDLNKTLPLLCLFAITFMWFVDIYISNATQDTRIWQYIIL